MKEHKGDDLKLRPRDLNMIQQLNEELNLLKLLTKGKTNFSSDKKNIILDENKIENIPYKEKKENNLLNDKDIVEKLYMEENENLTSFNLESEIKDFINKIKHIDLHQKISMKFFEVFLKLNFFIEIFINSNIFCKTKIEELKEFYRNKFSNYLEDIEKKYYPENKLVRFTIETPVKLSKKCFRCSKYCCLLPLKVCKKYLDFIFFILIYLYTLFFSLIYKKKENISIEKNE